MWSKKKLKEVVYVLETPKTEYFKGLNFMWDIDPNCPAIIPPLPFRY
jgi:hypothetical protein